MIDLGLSDIKDSTVRDNFATIIESFRDPILNCKWKFFSLTLSGVLTNYRFMHNMGFVPKDILILSQIGVGVAEFNYELFSNTHLDISTSDSVVVRFLAGNCDINSNA